jgi:Protein of unknown function (DUF4231)
MSWEPTVEAKPGEETGEGAVAEFPTAWARLENQITWYSGKSQANQRWFKALKACQIVIAAAIPVAVALGADAAVGAVGGGLIVVLEGLQQMQQYQQNWITYRATCERLKHEKFLFATHAGPYAMASRPEALLAERVEGLVSQEHAAWEERLEGAARGAGGES